ncbi:MAG: hypothetical protein KJ556_04840 [Gammaproteobacteria bacterium]|nr:hypothetical protein [Gammaproteobacteria bacterium]MBU2059587.1 hypothetical protein [Gammaproteobacteria bacterium]MBU2174434.1 hypothetical protein [Gammaproteobacteria bacterium]MBU2248059.1 hypothetical protein [Gammaproteobacteria bacterium]MBU2345529.1 hypothetical protein [Gammaproteobacteria bacterium]
MRVVLTLCLLFVSSKLWAAFDCKVDLHAVLIYGDGTVNVLHSGRGDYTHICNLSEERLGVSPTTCALWASMLVTLKKDGKKADFYYNSTPQYNSCATLPHYSGAPAPVYIGAVN